MNQVPGFRAILSTIPLVLVLLAGCAVQSRDGNPHDDWVMISKESEKEMGRSAAQRLEEQVGLYKNDTYVQYVQNVGNRVAVYSERPNLNFHFKILDLFIVNAMALPGGYIYVTRGLLKAVETEAQLAGILAHEVAHVTAYHAVKRRQWQIASLLATAAVATQTGGRGVGASLAAQQMFQIGYTRQSEEQADKLGIQYMVRAGYDPHGLTQFLQTLGKIHDSVRDRDLLYMRTHPFISDRIRDGRNRIQQAMQTMSDSPIVNRSRYQRYKRRYLFTPAEEELLTVYHRFIHAYEEENLEAMRSILGDDFQLGNDTNARSAESFLAEIEDRFQNSRRIEYDERLMKLDVGDTDATLFYEFESRRWPYDQEEPILNSGRQKMIWKRRDNGWNLIRLR